LQGLRVLDFTRVLAGPFATQNLGDLGAEILKVESPESGDETRKFPPFAGGESHYFLALNRNKKSLVIDLQMAEGADIVRRLVAKCDVLVENFRPGVMDRLGLGYAQLSAINPRLIYCAISGFGLTGPLRERPSFDIVTQALTGALSVNGEAGRAPVKLGLPLGDMVGGIFGPMAILAVLHERARTGRGRLIDVSLFDGLIGMLGYLPQLSFLTGRDPAPTGSSHPTIVPYGSFRAADGEIIIAALSDAFWIKLCQALGLDQLAADARFATLAGRREHREEIDQAVAGVIRQKPVRFWQEILSRLDVPHAPVLGVTAALSQPHALARDMVVEANHPAAGAIRMTGRPVKFPDTPQAPLAPPPMLGEHTGTVLAELLGLSGTEIESLRQRGVIDRGCRGPQDAA
jgi:crotonobetainyl-CoA:carnitine CoA-transferase CaiB-like acyl-CoA transferase